MNIELLLKKLSQQHSYHNSQTNRVSDQSQEIREHAEQLKKQIKKLVTQQSITVNATPKSAHTARENSIKNINGGSYLPVTRFQYQTRHCQSYEKFEPLQGIAKQMGNASCISYEQFQKDHHQHNRQQKHKVSFYAENSCESKRSVGIEGKLKVKHNLKPSNTPSFPKFKSLLNQEINPRAPSSSKKPANSHRQSENTFNENQDENFSYEVHDSYQSQEKLRQFKNANMQQSYKRHDFRKQQKNQSVDCHLNRRISQLENNTTQMQHAFQQRFRMVFKRMQHLQAINKAILDQNQSLKQQKKAWQNQQDKVRSQNQKINQALQKQKCQKEQLQGILKQILFKRERQKLHDEKSKNLLRPHINKVDSKNGKLNKENLENTHQSKMKVQNLLQKLQIKVQRS